MLAFIREYLDVYRRSPLIREIQAGCRITTYKSALDRLIALERKGMLRRLPNKHRGIRLLSKRVEGELTALAPQPNPLPTSEAAS